MKLCVECGGAWWLGALGAGGGGGLIFYLRVEVRPLVVANQLELLVQQIQSRHNYKDALLS